MEINIEQLANDLKELSALREKAFVLEESIKDKLNAYCVSNSIHKAGDIVKVFNSLNGKCIGKGIIGNTKTLVITGVGSTLYSNISEIEKDLKCIVYEIFDIRKDGTRSAKHFFTHPHFIPDFSSFDLKIQYDYYIKENDS